MSNEVTWGERRWAPSKVVCVGRNYVAHIEELNNEMPGEVVLFVKPNSAVTSELWVPTARCRYEAEICFLVEDGQLAAAGVGLDLTLVDVQQRLKEKRLPWEKAKAFDRAAVLGTFVAFSELAALRVQLLINDELRQDGGVGLMMCKPEALLAEARRHFTLCDGDILMTGTPKGVGDLHEGDRFEARLLEGDTLLVRETWVAQKPT